MSPATATRRLAPDSRVQFLPGIGPARARAFERLGLVTLEQLLRHYPRAYLDARRFSAVRDLAPGALVTVRGAVRHAAAVRTRGGRTDFVVTVDDGTGQLPCYFFGQPFLARTLRQGLPVIVSGELDPLERRMANPLFEVVEDEVAERLHVGRLIPVHGLTRGVTGRGMRVAVRRALDEAAGSLRDPVPEAVVRSRGLAPLEQALRSIHFPDDDQDLAAARRRLAFDELFLVQCVMELRRHAAAQGGAGRVTAGSGALARRAEAGLPFALTGDQRRALDEIVADLHAQRPMQRLLLGDVGSGKTVVAFLAALHVLDGGHQAAFLAPTEILAQQHARTLAALAEPAGVEVALLTGATPAEERRRIQERLDAGDPLIVSGTHALLEERVRMPALGLAIVDEQHRFGVRQRAALVQKGVLPDVLVLTATPIPRTLQLVCFGDLDVSTIAARPSGRGRLVTRIAGEEKLPQVLEFMARELAAGRQAFVVVPLIEDEAGNAGPRAHRAAEAEHRRLSEHPALAGSTVGLLHGKLSPAEKQRVMRAFAAGEVHVLVTTTVVEVGVDVPNATLVVIQSAERFGLTQLHQLRGRVGRGRDRSVCVLMPGPLAGAQARARLEVLARTENGFEIADADLELRGPGEMWGVRQSGLPRFRVADLRDRERIDEARAAAREVIAADPHLGRPEHAALRAELLLHFKEPLELALAG